MQIFSETRTKLWRVSLGSIRNKNNWNNASKRCPQNLCKIDMTAGDNSDWLMRALTLVTL